MNQQTKINQSKAKVRESVVAGDQDNSVTNIGQQFNVGIDKNLNSNYC